MLTSLAEGRLSSDGAFMAAALTEGMLRLLQLRHKRLSKERFGEWLIASLFAGGRNVLKGGQQPDSMYSSLFGGIATDPSQVLKEKLEQWCGIWKCNDAAARKRACRAIRKAIAAALQAGDYDDGPSDTSTGSQRAEATGSFRATTSVGCDYWPLTEYAMCAKVDLDRFGLDADRWKKDCVTPCNTSLT